MKINFFTFDQMIDNNLIFHKRSSKFYYCLTGGGGWFTTVWDCTFGWVWTCWGIIF